VISAHTFVWLYFFNLLPSLSRLGMEQGLGRFQELMSTSMRLVCWVALGGATIGTLLSPFIIGLIYGPDFAEASRPFAVMVWVLAAAFVSGHHRFALIALSLQREEFWASVAGALVSVGGCLALGSSLTPLSAAAIFVLAETTTLVAATAFLKRSVPHLRVLDGLMRPLLVTLLGALLLRAWSPSSVVAAGVLMGAVYLGAIVALERDGIRRLVAIRESVEGARS
jgi:O-antigen/teichoic acid export membrane protein